MLFEEILQSKYEQHRAAVTDHEGPGALFVQRSRGGPYGSGLDAVPDLGSGHSDTPRFDIAARRGAGPWKGRYSALASLGFAPVIKGDADACGAPALWLRPAGAEHVTGALVLIGFILLTAAYWARDHIKAAVRDPMVLGVGAWALGHLVGKFSPPALALFVAFTIYGHLLLIGVRPFDRCQLLAPTTSCYELWKISRTRKPSMPVLRQVPKSEAKAEIVLRMYKSLFGDRDPVAEPGTATGTPGDWWTVFALAPDILQHAVDGFAVYRHPGRKIDPVLRELGQTRAGWVKGSQFVFSQHCKSLRGLGVSDDKIAAVPHWAVSDLFNDQERTVLAYADCLAGAGGRTPDAVFDKLRNFWNDEQIFEFTYITCLYDMHAVMARALKLEYDNRPDPIVEVAAPESFTADDFLGGARRT